MPRAAHSSGKPEPGSVDGDTVNCFHKRGGCKCLEKAIALARKAGKSVYIATEGGRLKVERKERSDASRAASLRET
jgi:hypothetical protein